MVTVFVGVYGRVETLERTVVSYRRMKHPYELVIVDNGSRNPATLELLHRLEQLPEVRSVYRLGACADMEDATRNFNHAMTSEYERTDAEWFAVTEADVCFDGTNPSALDAYIKLAKKTGRPVGPHLRVDQHIPWQYPLRSRVHACETWMYYKRDMQWLGKIPYSDTQIDTTFHLFPRAPSFNRLHMDPLRVGPPYDAMHLDWYINIFEPNQEQRTLIPDATSMVGSWGKAWIRDYWTWLHRMGAEYAFRRAMQAQKNQYMDLCNWSFVLSWAFQYGVGVEVDMEQSRRWLRAAIPTRYDRYWNLESDWMDAVYLNDVSGLGWQKPKVAA